MPDEQFKILITSEADNTGFTSAADSAGRLRDETGRFVKTTGDLSDATKDLGDKQTDAGEKTQGHAMSARGLHGALRLIAHESGPAVGAAVAGAAAIMTGGMFAAVFAVRELFQWIGNLQKKAEDFRERQAAVWLAAEQGAKNAATAAQEFNDKLEDENTKTEKIKTSFENQKKVLDAQIDAHKKLLEAIEKEELATAGQDKARIAEIKERFEGLKAEANLSGQYQKMALDQKLLGELSLDKIGADFGASVIEKIKENLVAQTPQLKTALDNITKEFGSPEKIKANFDQASALLQKGLTTGGMKELPGGGLEINDLSKFTAGEAWDLRRLGGVKGIHDAQQNWSKYQAAQGAFDANESALKEADRGLSKARATGTSDASEISSLTASISELAAELKIKEKTAAEEREIKNITDIAGRASAGMPMSYDEGQFLMRAANMATGHSNTIAQAVELFEGSNKNTNAALERLVAGIENQGAYMSTLAARVDAMRNRGPGG